MTWLLWLGYMAKMADLFFMVMPGPSSAEFHFKRQMSLIKLTLVLLSYSGLFLSLFFCSHDFLVDAI